MTNLMARVVIIAVVLVLFIQLASSQSCSGATSLLFQCNDDTICRNPCRGYFEAYINACGGRSGSLITPNLVRCMHTHTQHYISSY